MNTNHLLAGAIGGLAGGVVMTMAMTAGKKAGIIERPLPVRVERWATDRMGIDRPAPEHEDAVAQGGHLVYSALLGAGYGALRSALDLPALPSGPLYGAGIYALTLGGVGPALGLTGGPWDEPKTTAGRRLMMHLVYGAVTAIVAEQVPHWLGWQDHDHHQNQPDRPEWKGATRAA